MKRTSTSSHSATSRRKVNGHAGANGSALLSNADAALHANTGLGKAGSDGASEFSAANAASLISTAGADRKATADLAESAADGRSRADGTASGSESSSRIQPLAAPDVASPTAAAKSSADAGAKPKKENRFADVPPGRKPLPVNGEAFVKAVHRQVDLIELEVRLLRDNDEKIVQRELAYLRELRYGKRAPAETENDSRPMLYDAPRPPREIQ